MERSSNTTTRNQLVDGLRSLAVLAMIVYHFAWDLGFFNIVDPVVVNTGAWKNFAISIGSSFLFISGISFWLATRSGINFKKFMFRLSILVSAALLVSLGTYQANPNTFVFFGILHLLSACTFLGLIIYKFPSFIILFLGIIILLSEPYLVSEIFEPKYLAWTGLYSEATGSVDFYGFFPWSSAYIFGLVFAKVFFGNNDRKIFKKRFSVNNNQFNGVFLKIFFWSGRNSLFIYLIHQPILIAIIYLYLNYF